MDDNNVDINELEEHVPVAGQAATDAAAAMVIETPVTQQQLQIPQLAQHTFRLISNNSNIGKFHKTSTPHTSSHFAQPADEFEERSNNFANLDDPDPIDTNIDALVTEYYCAEWPGPTLG